MRLPCVALQVKFYRTLELRQVHKQLCQILLHQDFRSHNLIIIEVADRALAVGCLLARWGIESMTKRAPELVISNREAIQTACSTIQDVPVLCGFTTTKKERRLLTSPPGGWTDKSIAKHERRWETFGTLMWALNHISDMPPFDTHFDREEIFRQSGLSPNRMDTFHSFKSDSHIRTKAHIEKEFERASFWQWRAHMLAFAPSCSSTENERLSYQEIIKSMTEEAQQKSAVQVLHDDFYAQGTSYGELSTEIHAALASIAQQRLFALGWILEVHDWME